METLLRPWCLQWLTAEWTWLRRIPVGILYERVRWRVRMPEFIE